MKKRNLILSVLILALVLSAGIGSAWAYFTTFATARGGLTLHLGYRTEFEESVSDAAKHIVIRYDDAGGANTQEVYVRVKAFGPEDGRHGLSLTSGEGWTPAADGWYVYTQALGPGVPAASELVIGISGFTKEEAEQFKEGENFNVAVVYECAPVIYNEDGSAVPATDASIWAQQLIVKTETPAEGGE